MSFFPQAGLNAYFLVCHRSCIPEHKPQPSCISIQDSVASKDTDSNSGGKLHTQFFVLLSEATSMLNLLLAVCLQDATVHWTYVCASRWYARYAGWAPEQLERECKAGVWFTAAASAPLILEVMHVLNVVVMFLWIVHALTCGTRE